MTSRIAASLYRPFSSQWLYYDRRLNEVVYQMPQIFPFSTPGANNQVICVSSGGSKRAFSVLMTRSIPSLHMVDIEGTQCFPRYLYPEKGDGDDINDDDEQRDFIDDAGPVIPDEERRDAITDTSLEHFRAAYPGEEISKDDVFYYIYGLLHSENYRNRFGDNLSKELPRIPLVRAAAAFRAFVAAGRELGELHCGYEGAALHPITIAQGDLRLAHIPDPTAFYRVTKMRFVGKGPVRLRGTENRH